jgi:uncharacterized membrane protein YwzB
VVYLDNGIAPQGNTQMILVFIAIAAVVVVLVVDYKPESMETI